MFTRKYSAFGLLFLSLASFAQTGAKPKPTPKPVASGISQMTLTEAKTFAESEVRRLNQAITAASSNRTLLPCDFYALETELAYNEWFLKPEHYQQFEQLNTSVDSAIAAINTKLASLENETVNVLVYQGQNAQSSEVPVAFKDLIEFFKLYEDRMKACPKDQQAAMIEMMETRPLSNPMHIVLSQVRAAGGMMSVNLNASLQETGTNYTLVMTPKECGYSLELKVEADLNGLKEVYRFSLLNGDLSSQKIELGEREKWAMLSKGKIDEMPVDGLLRYRKFQDQYKGKCNGLAVIPSARYGLPYVKYAEVPKIAKELPEQGLFGVEFVAIEPKGFEMQTTEVTQEQWFEVMKKNPSHFTDKTHCPRTWKNGMCPRNPVDNISWDDTQKFIQKLNERNDGYIYRLPTGVEWEYAARGGTTTAYFNGNGIESLSKVGWFDLNSGNHTHEVATAGGEGGSANSYGLYDMHGNVFEWVQDLYGGYPSKHILRGGCWLLDYSAATSSYAFDFEGGSHAFGFRLVRTPR